MYGVFEYRVQIAFLRGGPFLGIVDTMTTPWQNIFDQSQLDVRIRVRTRSDGQIFDPMHDHRQGGIFAAILESHLQFSLRFFFRR